MGTGARGKKDEDSQVEYGVVTLHGNQVESDAQRYEWEHWFEYVGY